MVGIYEIVNKVNKKCYIGKSRNINNRFNVHLSTLRGNCNSNKALQSDYSKYGEENFEFNCVLECDEDLLSYYELKTIKEKSKLTELYNENNINECTMYELLNKLEEERKINKESQKSSDIMENMINEQINKINIKKEDLKISYEDIDLIKSVAQMESLFNDNKFSDKYSLITKFEIDKHSLIENDNFKYISSAIKNNILNKTIRHIKRNYGSMIYILKEEDNKKLSRVEFKRAINNKGIEYRIYVEFEYALISNIGNRRKFSTSIVLK